MIVRDNVVKLIRAARLAGRLDFAHSTASDWLALWPGDLDIQLLLAQIEMDQTLFEPAIERLTNLVTSDPEFIQAYEALVRAHQAAGEQTRSHVFAACIEALQGGTQTSAHSIPWAVPLQSAIAALAAGTHEKAKLDSLEVLTADPDIPLPTLIAVNAYLAAGDRSAALAFARTGHDRWPVCVAFRLLLADQLLANGDVNRGVAYLHQAASDDPTARVTERILGEDHPYRNLWPSTMVGELLQPIPSEVAVVLGENRLPGVTQSQDAPTPPEGEITDESMKPIEATPTPKAPVPNPRETKREIEHLTAPPPLPDNGAPKPEDWEAFKGPNSGDADAYDDSGDSETLLEVEQEFLRLATRVNARRRHHDEDGRVPAYIVLSSQTRLKQSVGEEPFPRVDEAVMSLVEIVRRHPSWNAYRMYIDDADTIGQFGLQPADPSNAWQIKLRLADLDQALAQRGEMIGALLIVGGDRIVPFHRLPNPVYDDDEIVLSDNPYSTTDENYLAPEWPVGRFPLDNDPDLLVKLLRSAAEHHRIATQRISLIMHIRLWLARKLSWLFHFRPHALGYSASIWRKASLAVFKTIGEPRSLLTSPPAEAMQLPAITTHPVRLSYFNLHGLEDAPEWFGQRDPLIDVGPGPDFPVALRPQDVINSGNAPKIVFTEACYGANVQGKTAESALCLKFLEAGSHAILGSTKVSYGSVTTPLIAADLLGRLFWEQLNQDLPVGEAFRRAKLRLASEMHRRQGFLDGEDQKTLISFVLYGDPLHSSPNKLGHSKKKVIIRRKTRPSQMKTVCVLGECELVADDLGPDEFDRVKTIVSQYLPGMADAQCRIHPQQHFGCDGEGHQCPSHQLGIKKVSPRGRATRVFSFSKQVLDGDRQHSSFARLTLDRNGQILKFAVSR